jgi:hypothetical protein
MSSHPVNLTGRFLLELCALASAGYWGWTRSTGPLRFLFALGVPVLLALVWGIFAVPDDRSRSGRAPVPIPGVARLVLELAVFAFAAWALYVAGRPALALILVTLVAAHYAVSYDRIAWLLKQ